MKLSLLFVSFHKITKVIVISIIVVVVVMLCCSCVIVPVFFFVLAESACKCLPLVVYNVQNNTSSRCVSFLINNNHIRLGV